MDNSGRFELDVAEMEDDGFDIPEDLSAKHRTVSVQTDNHLKDEFEEIFEGFSQNQIRLVMDVLVQFVLKEDFGNNSDKLETISRKPKQSFIPSSSLGWTPLEPEPSQIIPATFPPNKQPPLLHRISPAHNVATTNSKSMPSTSSTPPPLLQMSWIYPNQNQVVKEKEPPSVQRKVNDLNKNLHHENIGERVAHASTPGPKIVEQYTRDKNHLIQRRTEEEEEENNSYCQGRLSRYKRLVVEKNIPLTVGEIIDSPMEEFNDLLSSQTVSEEQIHICRDIRRRGKNKIAAQNCRKRKISQISCLESQLSHARSRKENILGERVELLRQQQEWMRRLGRIERDILIRMGKEENKWVIKMDRNMEVKVEQAGVL